MSVAIFGARAICLPGGVNRYPRWNRSPEVLMKPALVNRLPLALTVPAIPVGIDRDRGRSLGCGSGPVGKCDQAHGRRSGRHLNELRSQEALIDDIRDLRRILYGLDAILRLHLAQEDEAYLELMDAQAVSR